MCNAAWRATVVALFAGAVAICAPATIPNLYPANASMFPRDIAAATFIWREPDSRATAWKIDFALPGRKSPLVARAAGEKLAVGPIDPDCIGSVPPEFSPELAGSIQWRPDRALWNEVRAASVDRPATVTIVGLRDGEIVSRGSVQIIV